MTTSHKIANRAGKPVAFGLVLALGLAACGTDDDPAVTTSTPAATDVESTPETTPETTSTEMEDAPVTSMRESGLAVTVQQAGDVTVHSLTAPETVFANSTHIFETENALVLVDTQFLLPMAADFRAYADSLGKPIDRVFITHAHPDHFLGSEAFADLPVFALDEVSAEIAANGDAEVAEKQGDFGPDNIASTYVIPEVVEPDTIEIDGVEFDLSVVTDAEAEVQLVIRVPEEGVVATGDIVYSGVHLILAGPADTWTAALNELAAKGDQVVLAGHGVPAGSEVFDENIAWLAKAGSCLPRSTTPRTSSRASSTPSPTSGSRVPSTS